MRNGIRQEAIVLVPRLHCGDTLGVIAPSSPVTPDLEPQLERGIAFLEGLGFGVVLGEHLRTATLEYAAPYLA